MIFCVFSGWFQKSGSEICCSSLANSFFFLGASKIAPHSFSLLAELGVLAFEFVEGHQFQYKMPADRSARREGGGAASL
jgi:hypothetical protein